MIYFTSDLHLDHSNIIKYANRPFKNVFEMNDTIIENINKTVKSHDDLWILGDFCMGDYDDVNKYLRMINCKNVHYVKGNHSHYATKFRRELLFDGIYDYYELKYNGYTFILCHYPMLVWNKKHHGSIHLYGHCHVNEPNREFNLPQMVNAFNVNCEYHNYTPVPITYFIDKFDPKAHKITQYTR